MAGRIGLMMGMKSRLVVLSVCLGGLLSLSGCWNKDFQEPGRLDVDEKPTDMIIKQGFSRVWAATKTTMAKFPVLKTDVDDSTKRAYLVTDWVQGKSDVLYRGYDVTRVPYVIRYKLYIYLIGDAKGDRTRVTIKNTEEYTEDVVTAGVDFQGGIHAWIRTESSTLKENEILTQIQKLSVDPKFKASSVE